MLAAHCRSQELLELTVNSGGGGAGGPSVPEPSVPEASVPEASVPEPFVLEPFVPELPVPGVTLLPGPSSHQGSGMGDTFSITTPTATNRNTATPTSRGLNGGKKAIMPAHKLLMKAAARIKIVKTRKKTTVPTIR